MKVEGINSHSSNIFVKAKKPMSIADRFAGIGSTVVRESKANLNEFAIAALLVPRTLSPI